MNLTTTFHPHTDGQVECTILTLEDMLRACVIDFKGSWDDHIHIIEFAYTRSSSPSYGDGDNNSINTENGIVSPKVLHIC